MFDITSNQIIKIHKGDDSGSFPLFINQGTVQDPIPYKFYSKFQLVDKSENINVTVDSNTFIEAVDNDGLYNFEYNYLYDNLGKRIGALAWYLNGKQVQLDKFGIIISGTPKPQDYITIRICTKNISEVYLYILDFYTDLDQALIKKTFKSDGTIITEFNDCRISDIESYNPDIIDADNNINLCIDSIDTQYLKAGNYCYQIRAKLFDEQLHTYSINTITNRLDIYIIDGEDSIIW